ncbi:MAG: CotH kinase family protein [Muribaculaceae bacterium]|nr:CotH kinase family protein [Muribaculaceae bacterium]
MKIMRYMFSTLALLLVAFAGIMPLSAHELETPDTIVSLSLNPESDITEIRRELKRLDVFVLEFTTQRAEFPTCDYMDHPEGCNGTSIINADYVQGRLVITKGGVPFYDSGEYEAKTSGVRVKLRGNSSSADGVMKKSYKVKLSKKADLLLRDNSKLKDKDWILLGLGGKKLNYVAGAEVARACGMPWEPEGRHVAVIMNDRYLGCYYLVEAVGAGSHRVNIDDSGYIVENDAYWWKPGEVYFKSNHQLYEMGWTFKEPDTDDFHEMSLDNVKWAINTVEQRLYEGKDVVDMIDYDSFAAWLLAHDIMATKDGYGSNIFLQKKDFDPYAPFSSKFQMGPLWDFDACLEENDDKHAVISILPGFWIHKLWHDPYFKGIYTELWLKVRDKIADQVLDKTEKYIKENPDIYKLRVMDQMLGVDIQTPLTHPVNDHNDLVKWFETRYGQLNMLLTGTPNGVEDIEETDKDPVMGEGGGKRYYNVDGTQADKSSRGIIISVGSDGESVKYLK